MDADDDAFQINSQVFFPSFLGIECGVSPFTILSLLAQYYGGTTVQHLLERFHKNDFGKKTEKFQ
jgi:hypothetical protein